MDIFKPFLFGATAGCIGIAIMQPVDLIKVRIQSMNESLSQTALKEGKQIKINLTLFGVAKQTIQQDGIKGLYQGLGSSLLRQILFTGTRFGLYRNISELYYKKTGCIIILHQVNYVSCGSIGAIMGNPADVALIRFQSDTLLPENQRRNYKNVFNAIYRIIKEEGVLTLWRGMLPTIAMASCMTLGQLAPYETIKEYLDEKTGLTDSLINRLIAGGIAGCTATLLALPPDNIKTKMQKMKIQSNGQYPYNGLFDCFYKTIQREGVLGLWVGLPTFMARCGPLSMMHLIIQDILHILSKKYNFQQSNLQ